MYAELVRRTIKSPYNFPLSDCLHPPVIHHVKLDKEEILVQGSENIRVVRIQVTLLDGEGHWWE